MINIYKRNILRKDCIVLNVVFYIDVFVIMFFIFSIYFNGLMYLNLVLEYLIFILMGIFFLVIMRILKFKFKKCNMVVFLVSILGVGFVMIFGN